MAEQSNILPVLAPLSGVRVPLSRVPDPVFAQRMVGDGASLDPTSSTLLAPIDGDVVQLHAAHHAITLRHPSGVDILIHIGIDTVTLRGEGFTPMVRLGDRVSAGQGLIRFDLDHLACRARSMLTQVVVANGERVVALQLGRGELEAGRSLLFSLTLNSDDRSAAAVHRGDQHATKVELPNPAGLHARPAAVFAEAAKHYRADVRLRFQGREANGKSLVALMSLATAAGSVVELVARGPDAREALGRLAELLRQGCGEDLQAARAEAERRPSLEVERAANRAVSGELRGVTASPGLAIGRVFQWRRGALQVQERGADPASEHQRLSQALRAAERSLRELQVQSTDTARGAILAAQQELLQDPQLVDSALALIDQGKSAAYAWQTATEQSAATLAALGNALLAERAADLRDIGRRVLGELLGEVTTSVQLPEGCILIAEDLTPSETADLDRQRLRGFCTRGGGATGHVAILARSFGLPALCAIDPQALQLADGQRVILDADRGLLLTAPAPEQWAQAERDVEEAKQRAQRERTAAQQPARSADGQRIEVVANVRHAADTADALAAGAEGVGLLRSELLFEQRSSAPDEDEQIAAYAAVARCLGQDRPLVIRSLDVGGDKPLSYLPLPREDNPFLGQRGVRLSLAHPALFCTQIRAVLRATQGHRLHLMLPMVATLEEFRQARALVAEQAEQLGLAMPSLGIMIEVPSAALLAEQFAREVDFMSIGSNDLTQYTLAMDRGHAQLAQHADALHPAVLRLIGLCGDAVKRNAKWLGVCGAMASDPLAVPALLGLGVRELSVEAPAVAAVKAAVARCYLDECRALAQQLVELDTASAVRARLSEFQSRAHAARVEESV
ncbi:phosphoenolpyruvate--protein phosphotransferase [Pseudomarimonas arenosa]|uniref:phosphoenolpyruvate--protein phosphotransferase n=1 Tax=Pseudomarimonas arenosa TaxID=2774145 RepID=A0AAW3ZNW0_9GAMM|nr:phosphoenolpyruvate--protein phosphotransferase [Pseudomarimonas arenosa]MBD8526615.1 phosphoenolpyruvate--protein phosphotransferase [Pseudomarimonas arenosa]